MEKMVCASCGATLNPDVSRPFLTCEYCDTSVSNPWYDEKAAKTAVRTDLSTLCLKTLLTMGEEEQLTKLDPDCFGKPIHNANAARAGISIPDAQQVYLLYVHTVLLLGFSDGFALTDGGLYYHVDGKSGSRSWESFITGSISCTLRSGKADGVLCIGTGVEFAVSSDKDERLARFLVDFHNRVYLQYTGETAPASWTVTEAAASSDKAESPSLLGTLIPVVGTLLGGAAVRKATAQRAPAMHPTSHPSLRQDRREHLTPPRPLHVPPHSRSMPSRPAPGSNRPGSAAHPTVPGHPGGPIRSGGPGRSGGPIRSGGPGRGRR